MYFPTKFTRTVAANAFWAQDTLPAGMLPAGQDNSISIRVRDIIGRPVHRLALGYAGPAGAPYLPADVYAWESNSQAWYKTHDAVKMLRPGRLNYYDMSGVAEPPAKASNLDQAAVGGTDLVLIIKVPPNTIVPANGTYTFSIGADLTTLGTEEPNPDDEANALQVITPSDGADSLSFPYGPCRWIWCNDVTVAHTVKFAAVDDADAGAVTINCPGTAGKLPFRARKVFATGTTATAGSLFAVY
jgi:hypothetical protein